MRRSRVTLVFGVVLLSSCSWTRFDDVQDDAPVVLLNKPDGLGYGFGSSLAAVTRDQVRVLVGTSVGSRGAAEFSLGAGQEPNADSIDPGHCLQASCALGRTIAAMETALTGSGTERPMCYAEGRSTAGVTPESVAVRCGSIPGQPPVEDAWAFPAGVSMGTGQHLVLAADSGPLPTLLVGLTGAAGAAGQAWFYSGASGSQTTLVSTPAGVGESFGSAVAVANQTKLHVGEPGAARLFLFDGATQTACLSGAEGFGRTLAIGNVDADGVLDVVVADKKQVHVLSGAALAGYAPADPATCVELPDSLRITTLSCRFTSDVDGCNGDFGAALAVANFDRGNGDTDGEVVVGAPGMSVRGESGAGAVLIFDVEPDRPDKLLEAKFISSAESGDRLGAALAVVQQPDRDILVAGAPGGGKAAVFYCSKLLPSSLGGARCE
jgi:hypothetical protein